MKLEKLTNKLSGIQNFIVRYAFVIFIVSVVAVFSFITLSIAHYANLDPTPDQIAQESALTGVKLDEQSISKIQQLQGQNINIESLFDNGRANPFQ